MVFSDRQLRCVECGQEFVFTEDEQIFYHDKQFQFDPKRCKPCRARRAGLRRRVQQETMATCAECGRSTTVPFKPRQSRPVLCRACFTREIRAREYAIAPCNPAEGISEPSELITSEGESLCSHRS